MLPLFFGSSVAPYRRDRDASRRRARLWFVTAIALCLIVIGSPQADDDVPDTFPPILKLLQPADGFATPNTLLPVTFYLEDPRPRGGRGGDDDDEIEGGRSGLDLTSLSLSVNGVLRTSDTVFYKNKQTVPPKKPIKHAKRGRLVYTPTAANPLPQGAVTLLLRVADRAGNVSELTSSLFVDSVAPVVSAVSPIPGATINDVTLPLIYQIEETGSGVDPASLRVVANGQDITASATFQGAQLTVTPAATAPWTAGNLIVTVAVADKLKNASSAAFTYVVQPYVDLAARPRAVPVTGDAPLKVTLIPDAVTTTAIERYEWDFDGNGTFDTSEVIGRNQTFTYSTPGDYDAALRVTDRLGRQATGRVRIRVTNAPPVVSANAAPSNGQVPLTVGFTGSATDNEGVALYEWDFTGDGVFDFSSPTSASTTFVYTSTGTFQPRLRVTDRLGASTTLVIPATEVRAAPAGSPTVTASATPASGDAPLTVNFSATATDPDGQAIVVWEWDFDGDGAFDVGSSTPGASHTYASGGTYFPRVRATAADGGTAVDAIQINVNTRLSLSIANDTIDPGLGETATVTTVLSGATPVSVIVESASGALVKTLVPRTLRAAGTYSDVWDGTNDQGAIVAEGIYFGVLLYEENGVTKRLDLRLTTGGSSFNPPRSPIPQRFAPFAGNPLTITYTLTRPAEVTAFIGRFNVDTRLITFMQREPRGRGTHQIVWNGESGDGVLIHPPAGDSFLFGIFGFTAADNAIYVRSGAHVSGVSTSPAIFNPGEQQIGNAQTLSSIRFTLSKAATVELTVYDARIGGLVATRRFSGLAAGANTVTWDGKNDAGRFVAAGDYRIGVTAVDAQGFRSTTVYALQRIYY